MTRRSDNVTIQAVRVVSVPVSDQERAKSFYVSRLGFDLIRDDRSVPGMRWVQVAPKGSPISLTLVTWFDSMPAGSLQGLVLVTDDLAADYTRLTELGVRFDQPPTQQEWATEAMLRDPDGNRLVLQQASAYSGYPPVAI
jgi:catechol 2,3-dioxygenase-like lactoylglutathione lyase family enzyme